MADLEELKKLFSDAKREIAKVIIGQEEAVELSLMTIFTRSHALIEGVPGIAKTLLVRTLGKTLDCPMQRIQFTPDLMPSDITGTNVFNFQKNEFSLIKGPIFTSFLLADEINRAPAKTQSALLQAMQERKSTIDGKDYELPGNFTVFATQNPIEYEGTYPLPEAQKDRFLLKINIGYPEETHERELAARMLSGESPESILERGVVEKVIAADKIPGVLDSLRSVKVKDEIADYVVRIVRQTRQHPMILVGAGPRATQAFVLASRVRALLTGRDFVTPDDIKYLSKAILSHRLMVRPEFEMEGVTPDEAVGKVLEQVPVPR